MINSTVYFITSSDRLELCVPSNYTNNLFPLNFSINNLGCFSLIKSSYLADKNAIETSFSNTKFINYISINYIELFKQYLIHLY